MTKPVISIVTGTVNRLQQLQRMAGSVRTQIPYSLPYEFVVVDNGSTDGTPEWVEAQDDMRLIQMGKPVGAIKAFSTGAKEALAPYVLLANDDIVIEPGSILNAVRHLEDTSTCGAVAFKNNRTDSKTYGIQEHLVQDVNGKPQRSVYLCVGVVRKPLGDACGWWLGDKGQMNEAWTYGGDNALSQEIHARGFTIDVVDGCKNTDIGVMDETRKTGHARHHEDGQLYRAGYEGGLAFGSKAFKYEHKRTFRILYLTGFANEQPWHKENKKSLREALSERGWVIELNYLDPNREWVHNELVRIMRSWKPHFLLSNIHSGAHIDSHVFSHARAVSRKTLCVNWIGDVWNKLYEDEKNVEMWRLFDLTLTVNALHIETLRKKGIRADFWGSTFEHVDDDDLPDMPVRDVVFQGNKYNYEGKRAKLGEVITELGGALYGSGWKNPAGNTFYDFRKQRAVNRNAKIIVSDNQFGDVSLGYTSNRFFNSIASGTLVLHQHSPGFEEWLGFKAGKHYVEWTDLDDLRDKVQYYLEHDDEREKIAKAGARYARRWHSPRARVEELFRKIIPRVFSEEAA